jgi:predicted transcriptional regulator
MTNKQKILEVIDRLPDETSIDQAIDALCLLQGVELGLKQADEGKVIPHDEVMRRLKAGSR